MWEIKVSSHKDVKAIKCKWLVDGSGRSSVVSKQLGIQKIEHDRLLAFIVHFKPSEKTLEPGNDNMILIESVQDGWWYSTRITSGERICIYHTDANLPSAKEARTSKGFIMKLKNGSKQLHKSLLDMGYIVESCSRPICVSANSACLECFGNCHLKWISVGDAALSFDPLSSQGITTALMSGVACANTIARCDNAKTIQEQKSHMVFYCDGLERVLKDYLSRKTWYYGMEKRYQNEIFWKSRSEK